MAKKTVATLQEGKTDGRSYTKVIKMVKSLRLVHIFLTNKWFRMKPLRISSRTNLKFQIKLNPPRKGRVFLCAKHGRSKINC